MNQVLARHPRESALSGSPRVPHPKTRFRTRYNQQRLCDRADEGSTCGLKSSRITRPWTCGPGFLARTRTRALKSPSETSVRASAHTAVIPLVTSRMLDTTTNCASGAVGGSVPGVSQLRRRDGTLFNHLAIAASIEATKVAIAWDRKINRHNFHIRTK